MIEQIVLLAASSAAGALGHLNLPAPPAPAARTVASLVPAAPLPLALAPLPQDGGSFDFSYTFVEVGATRLDLDEIDDEADTYYGLASIGLFDLAYVFAGYENLSTDFDNSDTDLWSLGAGVHLDLANDLDLTGDIAWLYNDLNGDTVNEDSNGHRVRVGARWMPIPVGSGGLEIQGNFIWLGLDDSYFGDDTLTGFDATARFHFNSSISVAATYQVLEDADLGGVNVRFSF